MSEYKIGNSLIWNNDGKFIEQNWSELKTKILKTQGGKGIVADDFIEMLQYRPSPEREKTSILRTEFYKLISEARSDDDINLLSEILYIMLINPWEHNIEAGWFVYLLSQSANNSLETDRIVKIINQLYELNAYPAIVLCNTLKSFVEDIDNPDQTVFDKILATGKLNTILAKRMATKKIFISYAKEDAEKVNKLKLALEQTGSLDIWKDDFELLPGEKWELKIKKELKKTDFVIICFSKASVNKFGYFQVEVKEAKKLQNFRPDSKIFIIPVRLDSCEIPDVFEEFQYFDLFENFEKGIEAIRKSIFLEM